MICTTEGCGRETELYLCTEHIVELDALLKDVPALIELLAGPRAGTAVVRKAGSGGGGGGGGVAGSKPPGSLDAMMLQAWLAQLPDRAHTAATDIPNAGEWLYMARIWVNQARQLVWGQEEETVNHAALQERVKEANGTPLPPREAIDYLRNKTKVSVKMYDFKNWVKLGHLKYVLDRVSTDENARRIYYPGEIFRVAQKMRERRVKI